MSKIAESIEGIEKTKSSDRNKLESMLSYSNMVGKFSGHNRFLAEQYILDWFEINFVRK